MEEGREPWHASIILCSPALLPATEINPEWPPLTLGEELMFPEGHIAPWHWVVTLRGRFRVRTQYTLLTPLILDYCHVRLTPVITHRLQRKGRLICAEVSLPQEVPWLNTVRDNKRLHSFLFSDAQREFSRTKKSNLKQSMSLRHFCSGSHHHHYQCHPIQQLPGNYLWNLWAASPINHFYTDIFLWERESASLIDDSNASWSREKDLMTHWRSVLS